MDGGFRKCQGLRGQCSYDGVLMSFFVVLNYKIFYVKEVVICKTNRKYCFCSLQFPKIKRIIHGWPIKKMFARWQNMTVLARLAYDVFM